MTFENSSSLFITTEVINKAEPGKPGEITVFEAVKEAFKDRDCLGFSHSNCGTKTLETVNLIK